MPELTVASTTDTDADVKRAANVPIVPEQEPVTEPEQPELESPEEQPEQKPQVSGKSAFQKRIDKLTRERSEAERRAQAAEDRLREFEAPSQQEEVQDVPQVQEQPQGRVKPKPEDVKEDGKPKYASYEEFIEDLADWKVEQKEFAKVQQEAQAQWEEQRREVVSTYNRNVTDFKKDHPDYDRIVNQDLTIPQVAIDAAFELGNPGIAYYLGQHPEICKELTTNVSRPGWVAARIGQIDTLTATAVSEPEEQEPAGFPQVRRSSAPAPIKPVGGSSTKSSVPLDEMPYSEYRKLRDQQVKSRYRR